jgi:hypothetical protein
MHVISLTFINNNKKLVCFRCPANDTQKLNITKSKETNTRREDNTKETNKVDLV